MILFPTLTCVDNFFDDPDSVRDYALSCTFHKISGNYPGIRTDPLHIVNPSFYELVTKKITSIFCENTSNSEDFVIQMHFQQMFKHSEDINDSANCGWSHLDGKYRSAGLVYLNNVSNIDSGTIICDQKDPERKKPYDFFYRDALYQNKELLNNEEFMDQYKKNIVNHNENFDDSIIIKNKYNRFIFYSGNVWHREQNVSIDINENRLTLVMFLN
jgi:hypothetical protein